MLTTAPAGNPRHGRAQEHQDPGSHRTVAGAFPLASSVEPVVPTTIKDDDVSDNPFIGGGPRAGHADRPGACWGRRGSHNAHLLPLLLPPLGPRNRPRRPPRCWISPAANAAKSAAPRSKDIKAIVGTDLCMHAHIGLLARGQFPSSMRTAALSSSRLRRSSSSSPVMMSGLSVMRLPVLIEFDFEGETVSKLGMPDTHRLGDGSRFSGQAGCRRRSEKSRNSRLPGANPTPQSAVRSTCVPPSDPPISKPSQCIPQQAMSGTSESVDQRRTTCTGGKLSPDPSGRCQRARTWRTGRDRYEKPRPSLTLLQTGPRGGGSSLAK
jgi:hypothetical protein